KKVEQVATDFLKSKDLLN
ncbi:hypothetical protein, partial [Anaerotignum propionicum]